MEHHDFCAVASDKRGSVKVASSGSSGLTGPTMAEGKKAGGRKEGVACFGRHGWCGSCCRNEEREAQGRIKGPVSYRAIDKQ